LITCLEEAGIGARVAWTPAERAELVQASADQGCRCLVAAGGDGTVAALINESPRAPITVLPVGTENLFARHFGIRSSPEAVAELIARGKPSRIDLGTVDGRRFSLMAGFGFDAEVVTRHHKARVGQSGLPRPTHRAAYVWPVLQSSWSYRFPALTVHIDDPGREEVLVGTTVFLFNLPRYALGLPFAPSASEHDGKLDLVIFRNPGSFQALHYLWLVWRGIHLKSRGVTHRQVGRVRISALDDVALQLDGDPAGRVGGEDRPGIAVGVLPGALEVLVPSGGRGAGSR
jgi:diacylglycerol kinase family enzyme